MQSRVIYDTLCLGGPAAHCPGVERIVLNGRSTQLNVRISDVYLASNSEVLISSSLSYLTVLLDIGE